MTITSTGYAGQITTDDEWGRSAVHGSRYGVELQGDFAVTTVPNGDRAVRVAPGTAWGKGILDVSDAQVQVPADPITSGSRWDTVVLRRNRDTKTTTVVILKGDAFERVAPSRLFFSATSRIDDQPIAMVNLRAEGGTSGRVNTIYDLRCWAANGGVTIRSGYAMEYLGVPGARVFLWGDVAGGFAIRARDFVFASDASGTWQWVEIFSPVEVAGAQGASGVRTSVGDRLVTTNGNGDFTIPIAFENQIYTAVLSDATPHEWGLGAIVMKYTAAQSNKDRATGRAFNSSGAPIKDTTIRVTYVAYGR